MHHYEKLTVWRKAHELAVLACQTADKPPLRRQREIAGQMRRAALSVVANIVEGSGRGTAAQFDGFLQISVGSAREFAYFAMLARDLGALHSTEYAIFEARAEEITRMLVSLRKRVVSRRSPTH